MNTVNTQFDIISACQEIGLNAGCNAAYTRLFTDAINRTEKLIGELTVFELLSITRHCTEQFNSTYQQRAHE